ncbi:MAG TPA: hypothetical protein VMW24_15880 [Sedimentisphaerales bacterium]|nr:hypothetical protein [Sedimentisphaerales bacterium]
MKTRNWLIIVAVLILGSLTLAQTPCPEQEYLSWSGLAVQIDPNQIAIHPVTGDPLFLGEVMVELGREWSYEGYACDEDGHAMTVTTDHGQLEISDAYVFTLRATETSIGVRYVNITATDVPEPPAMAIAVTGTLVVITVPKNNAPVLCGGRPQ